jgi:hypothetical protein
MTNRHKQNSHERAVLEVAYRCVCRETDLKLQSQVLADAHKLQGFLLIVERICPCHSLFRHALHELARLHDVSTFVYKEVTRLGHLQHFQLATV